MDIEIEIEKIFGDLTTIISKYYFDFYIKTKKFNFDYNDIDIDPVLNTNPDANKGKNKNCLKVIKYLRVNDYCIFEDEYKLNPTNEKNVYAIYRNIYNDLFLECTIQDKYKSINYTICTTDQNGRYYNWGLPNFSFKSNKGVVSSKHKNIKIVNNIIYGAIPIVKYYSPMLFKFDEFIDDLNNVRVIIKYAMLKGLYRTKIHNSIININY